MSARLQSSGAALLAAVCGLLTLGPYALRFVLLRTRTYDPDEFQHLHAAWALHSGLIPFRDFFEHHMPGIQLLLAPLMNGFDIAASADDAMRFMVFARVVMALFAAAAIGCAIAIAARRGGYTHGLLAGALLSTSVVFLGRTLEIRPDPPSVAFWLGSVLMIQLALERRPANQRQHALWAAAGACLGCALLFNQKLLLAGPGLAVWAFAFLVRRGASGLTLPHDLRRVVDITVFCAAVMIPLAGMALWFSSHDAFMAMVQGTVAGNLGWPREVAAATTLNWMALRDPVFSGLAIAGFVHVGFQLVRDRSWGSADGMLWLAGVSLLVFFFVTPTPFPQYLLLVLPIGAIFGADALWSVASTLSRGSASPSRTSVGETAGVLACFSATTIAALNIARPFFVHWALYPVLAFFAVAGVWMLLARRRMAFAAAVVLIAAAVYPLQQMRWMQGLSNAEQVRAMRYVHASTRPRDTVLDGFTGRGWFRRSASYYGFLHPGVRAYLDQRQTASIVETLKSCASRPRAVLLDDNLRELSPDVEPLVEAHYREGEVPGVWIRTDADLRCDSAVFSQGR